MSNSNQELINALPEPDWQSMVDLLRYAEVYLHLKRVSGGTKVDGAPGAVSDTLQAAREVLSAALEGVEEFECSHIFFEHAGGCMDWVLRCTDRGDLAKHLGEFVKTVGAY